MHCTACVSKIEEALYLVEGVTKAIANLDKNKAIVEGNASFQDLINAINKSGYQATLIDKNSEVDPYEKNSKQNSTKLFPLYLIFFYLTIATLLINRTDLNLTDIMLDFMGLFYIVFSFFKLLDYKNFPNTFKIYDPIAKIVPIYGWIYPFLETMLGLAFLIRLEVYISLLATLVILGATTIGVLRSLVNKESIQCACLGTAINLPMTTATLVENSIMLSMAIWMLITL
jgi:cation transport ATPase